MDRWVPSWEKSNKIGWTNSTNSATNGSNTLKDSLSHWCIEVDLEVLDDDVEVHCWKVN